MAIAKKVKTENNRGSKVNKADGEIMNVPSLRSIDRYSSEPLVSNQSEQVEPVDEAALSVVRRLRQAYDAAFACGRDAWDFSVELSQMQKIGVETHVLRTLICKGWIVHRKETTPTDQNQRTFEQVDGLALSEQSCFIISKQGYEIANSHEMKQRETVETNSMSSHHSKPLSQTVENEVDTSQLGASSRPHQPLKPVWDRERRELRLGKIVVKRFKWPAENQELVLDAFEDQGWPPRISNPLAAHPSICPKRRLHDTLKCLNRKQVNELVKFRGDGTGLGVLLEIRLAQ